MSTPLMGEFTFMEDWDLQAVVRGFGCSSSSNHQAAFANMMMNNSSFLTNHDQDDDLFKSFPEFFEYDTGFDHNHGVQREICKPFYPFLHHQQQQQQPLSPQSMLSSTSSMCIPNCEIKESEKLKSKQVICESEAPVSSTDQEATVMATGKSKRRKNQQKREVKHVKADGLSADKWAWRKYGQKPIKGSPYPRSYYRCSSLKGCLARKQVERSSTDPSIFIITYTAEHSHAHPTRRNSLAGSTRIKSTTPKQPKPTELDIIKQEFLDISGPSSSTTPSSMASINEKLDQLVQNVRIKSEGEEDEEHILENSSIVSNEEFGMPDIIFSDELFPSLEDFAGMYFDQ